MKRTSNQLTTMDVDTYKKTAKVGDVLKYRHYDQPNYVRIVHDRGVCMSLKRDYADHQWLTEWNELRDYQIIHKEP